MENEEFKKLKYSKIFVDKMILGLNPISGNQAGDNEVIKNPRVVKCLEYISENLGRQLEREVKRQENEIEKSKPPFFATREQLSKYQYPEMPITITKIADRINDAVSDSSRQKLKYKNITDFLEEKGYLAKTSVEGSRALVTTPKSAEIGITTEKRVWDNGDEYTAIIYNNNAQKYILESMDEIITKLNQ